MSSQKSIVVVGAGVVGVACAHYLSEAGARVVLLDKGTVGGACSHGNCGYVCPSHILPLAGPGMIGKTLKTLLQRESPLSVKPRFDPSLWAWMWRFARRCNMADMLESGRGIQALLNSSRQLYGELFAKKLLFADWQERGLLFVFLSPSEMSHYAEVDSLLKNEYGLTARRIESAELLHREPALKPGIAGAWHYECDAHLRPDLLLKSWNALLQTKNVDIRERCVLHGFERDGRRVTKVQTSTGTIEADAVVAATGAWTPQLSAILGCKVPIQPGKGYSITMGRPAKCPVIPMIFEEHRVAVTPFRDGYRIGSTMEFAGYDESMNRKRLELLTRGASHYLQEPMGEPVQEEWWGWRPMVPDGKPIVGRSPALDNVWIAAGHGMLGLSMATGTGKLVAELIHGTTPHVDPIPYSATRF